MILIGQYDSPFVRRVAIALRLYDMPFEHYPWSTFGDADKLAVYNPLRRVPTLVLEDGEALVESGAILDYLDELAGAGRAMIAPFGPERRRALKTIALAMGMGDKAVSLFYESILRQERSELWMERCRTQIRGTLDVLEADRAARSTPWWQGDRVGHADIAVACVLRFIREAHPGMFSVETWPRLAALATECEALSVFTEIAQTLTPPKS
ncbi:glutathione S-transferase family protein [Kaistia terrae]|uniref:Glutathione S-transferase family protein n=1 Tax=Kaistia terrae TaxID=537017 RepID=A0ABW0PZE4_9HYPH|nr:glutathione S-transferase N-terminal domain-containing protein [Kaistia terrae]MCX5579078.1 glutathione S-transferase N-terminal domain-containing protein [Kaistia terrae]